jgi:hypothetical protein
MTQPKPPTPLSSSETARAGASGVPTPIRSGMSSGLMFCLLLGLWTSWSPVTGSWGVPGFPEMPSLSADWGQVMWSVELAYSLVASTRRSLLETLVALGWDAPQSAWVSVKVGKKNLHFLTSFDSLLGLNTASLRLLSFFLCSA